MGQTEASASGENGRQARRGVSSSVQSVGPDLATEWLGRVKVIRPLSEAHVNAWAEQMRNGDWKITSGGVGFDQDGKLVDGQHRLHAVIESGVTVEMLVVEGLDRDAALVTDAGRPRRPADFLRLLVPGPGGHAAAVCMAKAMMFRPGESMGAMPKHEVAVYAAENLKLIQLFRDVHKAQGAQVAAAFCLGVKHGDGGRKEDRQASLEKLAERLVSMDWSGTTDPMKLLFKRLQRSKGAGSAETRYRLTVAAIRAALGNKRLEQLKEAEEDWKGRPGAAPV